MNERSTPRGLWTLGLIGLLSTSPAWAQEEPPPPPDAPEVVPVPVAEPGPIAEPAPVETRLPVPEPASECEPAARVRGDRQEADGLTRALVSRGLRVEPEGLPPGPCATLDVEIHRAGAGFKVSIQDSVGRRAERTVSNLLTAATLVESWAQLSQLDRAPSAPSTNPPALTPPIAAPAPSAPPAPPTPPNPPRPPAPVVISAMHDPRPQPSHFMLDVVGELGMSRDLTRWGGIRATGCWRLGGLCLGPAVRFAGTEDKEKTFEGYLELSAPIRLGRLWLRPAFAAGAGATKQEASPGEYAYGREFGGYDPNYGNLSARGEARLSVGFQLCRGLQLVGGGGVTVALRADREFAIDDHLTALRAHAGLVWGLP